MGRWRSRLIGLVLPMCVLAAFVAAMGYSWWGKRNHIRNVQIAAFSPDGKTLATGSGDGTIRLWDAASGRYRGKLAAGSGHVTGLRFSPDGKTLAAMRGKALEASTVEIWDTATRQRRHWYDWKTPVLSLDFSSDGKILAFGGGRLGGFSGESARLSLCDVTTGQERLLHEGGRYAVCGVKFLSDDQRLATWSWQFSGQNNRGVKVWDVTTGNELTSFLVGTNLPVFLPDRKTVAVVCNYAVKVWDLDKNRERVTLQGYTDPCCLPLFAPGGQVLATLRSIEPDTRGWKGGEVKLWNPHTGGQLRTLRIPPEHYPYAMAFSPDSKTLAARGQEALHLWETDTGKERIAITSRDILAQGIERFAVVGKTVMLEVRGYPPPPEVKAFDVSTGAETPAPKDSPGQNGWGTFAWQQSWSSSTPPGALRSRDGSRSVKNDEFKQLIVRNKAGREENVIAAPWIVQLALSDDGKSLVIATSEPSVQLYDLRTGQLKGVLGVIVGTRLEQLACSADGTTLAAVLHSYSGKPTWIQVETSVKVWNEKTGRLQADLGPYARVGFHTEFINGGALTADGRLLAVASYVPGEVIDAGLFAIRKYESSEVKVWDTTTGELRATLKGPERAQCHVAFSPTSTVLATWSVTNFPEGGLWGAVAGLLVDRASTVAPGEVALWDAATGRRIASLPSVMEVDFLLACLATVAFFTVPGARWFLWRRKRKTATGSPTLADISLC